MADPGNLFARSAEYPLKSSEASNPSNENTGREAGRAAQACGTRRRAGVPRVVSEAPVGAVSLRAAHDRFAVGRGRSCAGSFSGVDPRATEVSGRAG